MALVVGFLGVIPGLTVLFLGLAIALIPFVFNYAAFGIPAMKKKIRLAPSIFCGYVLWRIGMLPYFAG